MTRRSQRNSTQGFHPPKFTNSDVVHIAFVLVEDFSLFALACISEPLRVANRMADKKLFEFVLVSDEGQSVRASNGMDFNVEFAIRDCPDAYQTYIVVSGFNPLQNSSETLLGEIHRLAAVGANLGGVDTGTQILFKAGVMSGRETTMHWESVASFREDYPNVPVVPRRYSIDHKRIASAGGLSSLDMMLNIIWASHGHELAAAVADQFMYGQIRSAEDSQRMDLRARLMTTNKNLIKAVGIMEKNIASQLSIREIAQKASVSQRELERIFSQALNVTPKRYFRHLKLERARSLLRHSDMSVTQVSIACGFSSAAYMSTIYKQEFGTPPSRDRETPSL